jgi:cell division protein FtsL
MSKKPDKLTKGGKIFVAILIIVLVTVSFLVARHDDKKTLVHKYNTEKPIR